MLKIFVNVSLRKPPLIIQSTLQNVLSGFQILFSPKIKTTLYFVMGFSIPEIKTPVPPNAGKEIQSFVGMFNFISWGVSL